MEENKKWKKRCFLIVFYTYKPKKNSDFLFRNFYDINFLSVISNFSLVFSIKPFLGRVLFNDYFLFPTMFINVGCTL